MSECLVCVSTPARLRINAGRDRFRKRASGHVQYLAKHPTQACINGRCAHGRLPRINECCRYGPPSRSVWWYDEIVEIFNYVAYWRPKVVISVRSFMYAGFLTFKLDMTSALLVDRANAIYRSRWDLDVRALRVLRLIVSCPGVAPKVIAQRAFIEKTLLSKILRLLESRRLITRRTHTGDRRSVALEATPDGCNIAETSARVGAVLETELMSALTETQRNALDNILAVLMDSLLDENSPNLE